MTAPRLSVLVVAALVVAMACTDHRVSPTVGRRQRACNLRLAVARTAADSLAVYDHRFGLGPSREFATCADWLAVDTLGAP